jgi:hypothetical protein
MQFPASWSVKYNGLTNVAAFEACFFQLHFKHCVINRISTAVHIFNAKGNAMDGGGLALIQLWQAVQSQQQSPFQFQIYGIDGTRVAQQSHVILEANPYYAQGSMFSLTLVTGDVLATANIKSRSKAYVSQKGIVSDIVQQALQFEEIQTGLIQSSKASTDSPTDLTTLIQPYITSWRWIIDHLIPKSGGMWCLYSPNGSSANFTTPWYQASTCSPPSEAIIGVRERDLSYDMSSLGGYDTYGETIDRLTKKLTNGDASGSPRSFGNYDARWQGLRTVDSPVPDLVRESDQAAEAYPMEFEVTLYGSDKYNGQTLIPPLIIDLSNTGYRLGSQGSAKGVLTEAYHCVVNAVYTVKCICRTDGIQ